jgi:hypothetical protein
MFSVPSGIASDSTSGSSSPIIWCVLAFVLVKILKG